VGSLLVDGITPQETAIYDFSVRVTASAPAPGGGGGGGGKAEFTNVEVSRLPDAASPQFFKYAATGIHIPQVRIEMRKAGANASYVLHDALVTGFGNADGAETVAFAYRMIEVTVGGVTTCFDLATNASC
jgi:type VI protein secretion system component Hcp